MDPTLCIWQKLVAAGASVPPDPADLDATHLVLAAAAGVDVRAIITEVTPRSGERQTA